MSNQLEESLKAYSAVCEMLTFPHLSLQMERQLNNLKRLLELEISALQSAANEEDGEDGDGAAA